MDNLGFQHEDASFATGGEVAVRSPRLLPLIADGSRLLKATHSPKLSSSSFNLPKKSLNRYRRFSGSLRSWTSPQHSASSAEQVSATQEHSAVLSRYSLEDSGGGGGGCSECQSGDIYCITGAAVDIFQANNFKSLSPPSIKNMQLDCHSVPSSCSFKKKNNEVISDTSLDILSPKCLVKNNNNTYRSSTPESPTLLKKHQQALNNLRTGQGKVLGRSTTLPTITINNMVPSVSGNVPYFYPGFPGGSQQGVVPPSPRPHAENRQNMRRSSKYLRESGEGAEGRGATLLKLRAGGWKLQFIPSEHTARRRVLAFCCLLLVSCVLAAAATAALVVYMTTGMKSVPMKLEGVQDAAGESGVNVVGGEFTITNEMYEPTLSDVSSSDYKQLAAQITQQLNLLYTSSALASHYNHSHVTGLLRGEARGILVQCKLVLTSAPPNGEAANLAGLEFLRGLHHRQGQMWLGNFAIDVQSVGFVAVIETPQQTPNPALVPGWSPWSAWSECNDSHSRPVQSRTRDCRLNGGTGVLVMSIEPCLLLEGAGGDMEMRDCEDTVTVMSSRILESLASNDITESATSTVQAVLKRTTDTGQQDGNNLGATNQLPVMDLSLPSFRHCDECLAGEVCVALGDEEVPTCRQPHDPNDPTGCGGHCRINTELCHKLDVDAFRCLDDSYCLSNEWRCANQLCIPQIKRCDGHMNCYDHTDEFDCECDLKTHFHCGNNTSCLPLKKRCDSIIDCWDGSDELNCTIACPSTDQFTCNNGQCIPHTQFCDGYADCLDKSDEPFGCGGECKNHEWKCGNGRCISKSMVCEGTDDCGDKTDETSCPRARRGRMSVEIH